MEENTNIMIGLGDEHPNINLIQRHCQAYESPLLGLVIGIIVGILCVIPFVEDWRNIFGEEDYSFDPEVGDHLESDPFHAMSNSNLADQLRDKVKILCWIMTGPKTHQTKGVHVKSTWGKRCSYLIFMSSEKDLHLHTVDLPVIEDRAHLWQKTKEAMKYIYKHYYNKADWFFKADDDTYAIMENMRYFLNSQNSSEPVYFGCRFKIKTLSQGYMSGGGGYVLSKEALKRFVINALPNPKICSNSVTGAEDFRMGRCLENVGVKAGDSRDEAGRHRFFPLAFRHMMITKYHPYWLEQFMYYSLSKKGLENFSDSLITLHYVTAVEMYTLHFLIYHARPFGVVFKPTLDIKFEDLRNLNDSNRTREPQDSKTLKTVEESLIQVKELSWADFD